jgi:hypothetical protein
VQAAAAWPGGLLQAPHSSNRSAAPALPPPPIRQIIHHISSKRVISLGESCPPPLRKLVASCCNAKYEQRPTFAQLLTELDDLVEELC